MNLTQSITVICPRCGGCVFQHIADEPVPQWVHDELEVYSIRGFQHVTELSTARPWCGGCGEKEEN